MLFVYLYMIFTIKWQNLRSRKSRAKTLILWQTEEALMFSTESKTTKTQETTSTAKCIATTTTAIVSTFMGGGGATVGESTSIVTAPMHHV